MSTQPQDARHVPLSRVDRLRRDAAEAAQIRAYDTHPDVVALRVEHIRGQVDRLMWAGIVLGLSFTMVNVQTFAAAGAPVWSLAWLVAWLLDPMVSLVLIAVLRAEQITARYQVPTGPWPRRAKWFTLAATYVMNTWGSYAEGSPAGIVLHSVPPLVVFVAAEAVTDLRDKLTESVYRAHRVAADRARWDLVDTQPIPAVTESSAPAAEASAGTDGGTVHERSPKRTRERSAKPARKPARKSGGRQLAGDYLNAAREAWAPGIEITPAWVRQVTGCSRGLSSRLAAELRAETTPTTADQHTPTDTTDERPGDRPEGRAA